MWTLARHEPLELADVSDALGQAVEADPDDRVSRLALAETLRRLGRLDQADATLSALGPAGARRANCEPGLLSTGVTPRLRRHSSVAMRVMREQRLRRNSAAGWHWAGATQRPLFVTSASRSSWPQTTGTLSSG